MSHFQFGMIISTLYIIGSVLADNGAFLIFAMLFLAYAIIFGFVDTKN